MKGKMKDLNQIGDIYYTMGERGEALEVFKRSYKIAKKLKDISEKYNIISYIGRIYYEDGNFKKAIKCYEKSLKIAEKAEYSAGTILSLNNRGLIFQARKKYQDALGYYERAIELIGERDTQRGESYIKEVESLGLEKIQTGKLAEGSKTVPIICTIHTNMGIVYQAQGNYHAAIECYERALHHNELNNSQEKADLLHKIGMVYEEQSYLNEAKNYYDSALGILQHIGKKDAKTGQKIKDKMKTLSEEARNGSIKTDKNMKKD
jgi:tetratricopeptide (TPR) repeat protein